MTYLIAVCSALWGVIRAYFAELAAFLSAMAITRSQEDAKQAKARADALEERVAQENRVATMSDVAVAAELRDKWTRK